VEEPNLSPDLCRTLAHFNPLGMTLTEAEVRSWAFIIWPSFVARGYKNQNLALTNWWKRVTESDILQARARLRRMADEREISALEGHPEDKAPANVVDFAARLG